MKSEGTEKLNIFLLSGNLSVFSRFFSVSSVSTIWTLKK